MQAFTGSTARCRAVDPGLSCNDPYESTRTYYERIDREVNDALGGHNAADLVIKSVNFAEIERCIRTEQWDEASDLLVDAALDLEAAGADFVLMATNTMHRVAPGIVETLSIPFVHIVDQSDCPGTPLYDTTALHVDRAVKRCLSHDTDRE